MSLTVESVPPEGGDAARLQALRRLVDRLSTPAVAADPQAAPDLGDALAALLETDRRFRVLRRLVPRRAWDTECVGEVRRGLVLDTETTGLDPRTDRIVEIAIVAFEFDSASGRVLRVTDVYDGLEDPGFPIPPEVTRVNGITDAMVAGRRIDDARVEALAASAHLVIAHNAQFDRCMCEPRFPVFVSRPWACSLKQVDWKAHGLAGGKLELLAYELGFFYDAHRAENDCHALLEVLSRPLASGATALAELLEAARQKEARIWALDAPYDARLPLKQRGYRWSNGDDGRPRAWHVTLPLARLQEEIDWLRQQVYEGRRRQLRVDLIDALARFTDRVSRSEPYPL